MTIGNPVAILRQKFAQSIGLPFADVLSESDIEKALKEEGVSYRKWLFCPIVTLWAWLSQVLDKDKSCKKSISRLISYLVAEGQNPPSTDTGGYCKARKRLPERLLLRFVKKTVQLVRTLDIGLQKSTEYFNRDKAAYWDGRNEMGEHIASGVYFYQIEAGDRNQTCTQQKNIHCPRPLHWVVRRGIVRTVQPFLHH
jgi:hypothetical protein